MKIQTSNSATAALHDRDCMEQGYQVTFNDQNVATVKAEVGEALAEKYAAIEAVGDPSSAGDSGGKGPEDGPAEQDSGESDDETTDGVADADTTEDNE